MKTLLLFLFILFSTFSFSQTELTFSYDSAGNQIFRGPDTQNKTTMSEDSLFIDKQIHNDSLSVKEELIEISAAPNPTYNVVTVNWKNIEEKYFISATVFSYNNQLLQRHIIQKDKQQIHIDLTGHPQGIYILVFSTNTQQTQSYKIIKR